MACNPSQKENNDFHSFKAFFNFSYTHFDSSNRAQLWLFQMSYAGLSMWLSGRAQQPKYTYTNLWKEQRIIPLFCDIPWIIILHHARIIKSFHRSPLLCLTHVTLSLNDFLEYLQPRNATIYFWGKGQSFSLILIHRSIYISAWWCSVSLLISDPLV